MRSLIRKEGLRKKFCGASVSIKVNLYNCFFVFSVPQEVVVDGTVTQYSLVRLHPGLVYVVRLQAEDGRGGYNAAVSTEFTTGSSSKAPPPLRCSANTEH